MRVVQACVWTAVVAVAALLSTADASVTRYPLFDVVDDDSVDPDPADFVPPRDYHETTTNDEVKPFLEKSYEDPSMHDDCDFRSFGYTELPDLYYSTHCETLYL